MTGLRQVENVGSMNLAVAWTTVWLMCGCASSSVVQVATSLPADFVGSTPCDTLPRHFLKTPENAACECIQWRLTFHLDDVSASRGAYTLVATYGMSETNAPGFFQGGTKTEVTGQLTATIGSAGDLHGTVYHLQATDPARSLSLIKIDDNLLHILNDDGHLLVGNDSWSYTLNRIPKQP